MLLSLLRVDLLMERFWLLSLTNVDLLMGRSRSRSVPYVSFYSTTKVIYINILPSIMPYKGNSGQQQKS